MTKKGHKACLGLGFLGEAASKAGPWLPSGNQDLGGPPTPFPYGFQGIVASKMRVQRVRFMLNTLLPPCLRVGVWTQVHGEKPQ